MVIGKPRCRDFSDDYCNGDVSYLIRIRCKTTERKIELGINAKKQTELGKIKNSIEKDIKDYLKKGANLYDN